MPETPDTPEADVEVVNSDGFTSWIQAKTHSRASLRSMQPRDVSLFEQWLRSTGWDQRSTGPQGDLFQLADRVVAVPRNMWQDPDLAEGVASRVAQAMDRSPSEVLKRLVAPLTDRVEFRLVGEALSTGRIPLGAASEALKNGRRMLSASGTSAVAPGWSVARRYKPEAQALARDAELAHTEDGSFIFPLYVTLDRQQGDSLPFDAESVVPEPYERRVTRTLATALATVPRLTSQSVSNLTDDALDGASSVGVTRELCLSLDEVLKHSAIEGLAVRFDWSQAFGSTDSLPSEVELNSRDRPQLRALARRLARPEPVQAEVYSGPILEIGYDPDDEDEGYHFVLDTYFRERKSRLRVALNQDQHERAIAWYRDRATVIVRGDAMQVKMGLLMDDPQRIEAWADTRF